MSILNLRDNIEEQKITNEKIALIEPVKFTYLDSDQYIENFEINDLKIGTQLVLIKPLYILNQPFIPSGGNLAKVVDITEEKIHLLLYCGRIIYRVHFLKNDKKHIKEIKEHFNIITTETFLDNTKEIILEKYNLEDIKVGTRIITKNNSYMINPDIRFKKNTTGKIFKITDSYGDSIFNIIFDTPFIYYNSYVYGKDFKKFLI